MTIWMPTESPAASSNLNIETLGRELGHQRILRIAANPAGKLSCVECRQSHSTMTGNRKSAGMLCRAVIYRHAIRRHHAQRPPGPVEANLREMGEDTYRASSQSRNNLQRGRLVEADIFVRIPDLQSSFSYLSYLQG